MTLVFAGCSFAEARVALVMGNGVYQNAPQLFNPPNDADDVASALKSDGLNTILATDTSSAPPVPADTTKDDFEAAERVDSVGAWDVFLAQHPTGDYAASAKERRVKAVAKAASLPGLASSPSDSPNSSSNTAPAAKPGLSYLSTMECAAKYQAAKLTGTLNGRKWDDFRAAECGSQAGRASVEPAPAPTAASAPPAPPGNTVFPSAIDPKYAKEFSAKGRMRTCADQYDANKATNANGGMKWVDRGGGYYAECNRRLKGA
jgi:hypothetical protein